MRRSISRTKLKLPDEASLIRGLATIYTVGIVGHLVPLTLSLMKWLTPFMLLISGLMVLLPLRKEQPITFWLWCAGVFLITFAIEVAGVATGAVFGSYEYESTLGPELWNVPPLIGWNWLLVILGAIGMSLWIRRTALFSMFVGMLVVLLDFFLEPVAARLDYWEWQSLDIPLQNYLAWFSIGVLSAVVFRILKLDLKSRIPRSYFAIQLIFFIVLRLFL